MSTQTKQQTKINRKAVESLKNLNFEWLIQINSVLEDLEENEGIKNKDLQDFCKHLDVAVNERCNELINAEKKFKDFLNQDNNTEYEYEKIDEAEKFIKENGKTFDGAELDSKTIELMHKYEDIIHKDKSFESMLKMYDLLRDTFSEDMTNSRDEKDKNVYRGLLACLCAIGNVLREIEQADWANIEDYRLIEEESDIELTEWLRDYIVECSEFLDKDLLKDFVQFGFKDVYVDTYENEYREPFVALFDGSCNQLTDLYALC